MEKDYYVLLASWKNGDGESYTYDSHPVATFTYSKDISDVLLSFLKSEVYEGCSQKCEGLYKVNKNDLTNFKTSMFEYEIDSTLTYDLDRMLEVAKEELNGFNSRLRYRRSIHFCEQILEKQALCEETYDKAKTIIEQINEQEFTCRQYIKEEDKAFQDLGIQGLHRVGNLKDQVKELLDKSSSKLNELLKAKQRFIDIKAKDMEYVLEQMNWEAPILNFKVPSK